MTDGSSSDEDLELDDLEGLRLELETLRNELGDNYVAYQGQESGLGGSDEDEDGVLPLPGASPAAVPPAAPPRSVLAPPASFSVQQDSESEDMEAKRMEEEGGQLAEEVGLATEAEEQREEGGQEVHQAAIRTTAALQPLQAAQPIRRNVRNRQVLAPAPAAQNEQEQQKPRGRGGKRAVAAPAAPPQQLAGQRGRKASQVGTASGAAVRGEKQQQGKPKEQAGKKRQRRGRADAADKKEEASSAAATAAGGEAVEVPPSLTKVEAIREALAANQQLQDRLRRLLASTDRAIDKNAAVLLQVRAMRAKKTAPPAVATVAASSEPAQLQAPIGTSWFWGGGAAGGTRRGGEPVPPNPDAEVLLPLYSHLPFSFRGSRWSEDEQQRLREGVVQLVQEVQLQEVMAEMQQRLEGGGAVSMADYEASRQRIAALTLDSPVVCQVAGGFREEEWATLVQRSRLNRTTTECRLQWTNSLAPSLSQREWSAEEDAQLRLLAQQHQAREWDAVSRELAAATGAPPRPPLACLQRHQHLAAAAAKEGVRFEAEADMGRLTRLVAKHGTAWKRIAEEFGGGFDADQLMHIWRRHAQRGAVARKGRWSEEEDEALIKAMAVHGRKWSLVARMVPGRTDVQCRERYMNVLNPDVTTFKPWSPDSEQQLLELAAQHTQPDGKVKWSAVAAGLPGRTDKQCAARHKVITCGESGTRERKPRRNRAGQGGSRGKRRRKAGTPDATQALVATEGGRDGEGGEAGEGSAEAAEGSGGAEGVLEEGRHEAQRASKRPRRARRLPAWLASSNDERGDKREEGGVQAGQAQSSEETVEAEGGSGREEEEQQSGGQPERQRQQQGEERVMNVEVQQQRQQQQQQEVEEGQVRPQQQQQGRQQQQQQRKPKQTAKRQRKTVQASSAAGADPTAALVLPIVGSAVAESAAPAAAAAATGAGVQAPASQVSGQQAVQEAGKPAVLPAPPPPTASVMPYLPAAAVGQHVAVWWITDRDSGAGSMYTCTVVGWNQRRRQHSVQYAGERRPMACRLEQEIVEWQQAGGLVVTGPGALWPSQQPAAEPAQQQAQQQQEAAQQQQQSPLQAAQLAQMRAPNAVASNQQQERAQEPPLQQQALEASAGAEQAGERDASPSAAPVAGARPVGGVPQAQAASQQQANLRNQLQPHTDERQRQRRRPLEAPPSGERAVQQQEEQAEQQQGARRAARRRRPSAKAAAATELEDL